MFDSGVSADLTQNPAPIAESSFSATRQHTLKSAIACKGVGLHSGQRVTMTLRPAEPDTGIVFHRVDIAGGGAVIPARWSSVCDTRLNSCVADQAGNQVRTVEHLLAACAGMAIDNVIIEINGPEVPAMDGSAAPFLFLMECAGIAEQEAPRRAIKVLKRVAVHDGERMAALMPGNGFSLDFAIDFPVAAIRRQSRAFTMVDGLFKKEIGRARSFGFEQEVAAMRAAGLGLGGSLDNAVVIASDGQRILNEEGLRYEDEFVRHKMLDAVGDLYLAGAPLIGHFHGVRSGHALNNLLLQEMFADEAAWCFVAMDVAEGHAAAAYAPRLVAAAPF